ncbi:MAG: accessory factor UbiK family protein [Rhodospirillales bacterium]|nr:accessory factor UbiK family protein [Rhodospirillales bacterium]
MQTSNRILDDLAKVAGGAMSTLTGLKDEIEALVRQQLSKLLSDMDLVSREEFEAVKAVAARARSEQEKLEARVAQLEAKLGVKAKARKTTARKAPAAKKAATKTAKATAKPKPKARPQTTRRTKKS